MDADPSPASGRPRPSGPPMFFSLSKILFFAITPSNALIAVGLLGCLLTFTELGYGFGRLLTLVGFLGLLAGGLSPLSVWTLLPLEQRFPAFADDGTPIAGIVVLGGGLDTTISAARDQLTLNDAGERQVALADLARRYPDARLVFSGGGAGTADGAPSEAGTVSRFADSLGIPPNRLVLEERSRNTRENAAYTARIVEPKPQERWLLVTSAWHMPRAVGCFRAAGFTVVAYPVDYRTTGPGDVWRIRSFASDGLFEFDLAVKEWIGLLAYRLAGFTGTLLPKP